VRFFWLLRHYGKQIPVVSQLVWYLFGLYGRNENLEPPKCYGEQLNPMGVFIAQEWRRAYLGPEEDIARVLEYSFKLDYETCLTSIAYTGV
jgi:hypothetical protein